MMGCFLILFEVNIMSICPVETISSQGLVRLLWGFGAALAPTGSYCFQSFQHSLLNTAQHCLSRREEMALIHVSEFLFCCALDAVRIGQI